jgi:arabinose-5-phosphate isomerase
VNDDMDLLDEIGNVIDIEIEALQTLRGNLTSSFQDAVELIAKCEGQVFVTGLGKSGLIAQKIAATFRSTGTPALFVHPAEALHGDIGTVRKEDIVMAIGKSGESTELNTLLRVLQRTGMPIIALTSNPGSSMAGLADVVLDLHVTREACPLNLAPTSSTTVALAVGDAIAVTLMKMKDISEDDFARHHPGGQIGRRLLLMVSDVMRQGDENPVVPVDSSMRQTLIDMTAFHVGAVSVVDGRGHLLGLVTDYDVRRVLESSSDVFKLSVRDVMNPSPEVVYEDQKAMDALEKMRARDKPTAVLPVLNRDREVVGMVHLHDLIVAGL